MSQGGVTETTPPPETRQAQPNPTDIVHVIVHERPNKVWVIANDTIHSANWRTSDNGDGLRKVTGNTGLLNAAMLAWGIRGGQAEPFSLPRLGSLELTLPHRLPQGVVTRTPPLTRRMRQ